MIEHFTRPVAERTPEEMCDHARSILSVICEIPQDELNDGDIMLGQLAENVRHLVHAVPLELIERHRSAHPVDLKLWNRADETA